MTPPTVFTEADKDRIEAFLKDGLSYRQIARECGCNKDTVSSYVHKYLPEYIGRRHGKLLVVDIETMANLAWVWGTWQQDVAPAQIVQHKRTISFAAKWVGDSKIQFWSEFHHGHEVMVNEAWSLLDEADAVIGYNSKRFDVKHLNTEFKLYGYPPPSPFQQIDLLTVTRREFAFGSNKLEAVADRLGLGKKREHEGFALWLKCEAGDPDAWKRMRAYNKRDVQLTEQLFEEFREWIPLRGHQSQKRVRELIAA